MVAVSASPPVACAARLGQPADHTGLDQGTDHDEQSDEEQQRLPFDARHEVVGGLLRDDKHEQTGAEQGHHRRFDVQARCARRTR